MEGSLKYLMTLMVLMMLGANAQAAIICQSDASLRELPLKSELDLLLGPDTQIMGLGTSVERWYQTQCRSMATTEKGLKVLVRKGRIYEVKEVQVDCQAQESSSGENFVRCHWGKFLTLDTFTR
jgi:hypothetical protein